MIDLNPNALHRNTINTGNDIETGVRYGYIYSYLPESQFERHQNMDSYFCVVLSVMSILTDFARNDSSYLLYPVYPWFSFAFGVAHCKN